MVSKVEASNERIRAHLKQLKDEYGGYKGLFKKVRGYEPTRRETQSFTNYINRGVFISENMFELLEVLGVDEMSVGEFYKGEKPLGKNTD